MKSPTDPHAPWYLQWLSSKRTTVVVLTALGLLLVVFQINTMLSSSFRVEIFGVEVLEVEHLDKETTAEAEPVQERIIIRERGAALHQAPPLPPLPPPVPPTLDPETEENQIFVVVEQMPELIGGLDSIRRKVRYPAVARKAGLEGRVIVQFIVDKEGRVQDATVVRGIGGGCDEEALRVVSEARFRPGKQRGKHVKVKMSVPVTFRLQ